MAGIGFQYQFKVGGQGHGLERRWVSTLFEIGARFCPIRFFFLYKYVVSRVQVDRCMDNGYCIKGMSTVPEMYERGKGKCH